MEAVLEYETASQIMVQNPNPVLGNILNVFSRLLTVFLQCKKAVSGEVLLEELGHES
jgi:hypothetical protein